jgi:hypothetical protein
MTSEGDAPNGVTPEERQARAEAALTNIFNGANLGEETLKLSNEFTDEMTGKAWAFVDRIFRRSPRE